MIDRLTDVMDFQSKALMLRAERQRLIAGNIANADTPGYVAQDMDFAAALRDATGLQQGGAALRTTSDSHMSLSAGDSIQLALRYARPAQTNLDSNSVDMDLERATSAENTVKYEATLRFINYQIRNELDAMKSPSQG